jgi:hypothetical protein
LPKLVGIERAPIFRFATEGEVRADVDAAHAAQLTRDDITASVHYVHSSFTLALVEAFAAGPVTLPVDHPAHPEAAVLMPETVAELLEDLRADPRPFWVSASVGARGRGKGRSRVKFVCQPLVNVVTTS